jgi:hypothetical protein
MHALSDIRSIISNISPALKRGAKIFIVDTVRELSSNADVFAVNMAVNTPRGGTYSISRLEESLQGIAKSEDYEVWPNDHRLHYVAMTWSLQS